MDDKPVQKNIVQRFFNACLLLLGGIVAISLALNLLAQIWGWLLLLLAIAGAVWITVVVIQARRNRW